MKRIIDSGNILYGLASSLLLSPDMGGFWFIRLISFASRSLAMIASQRANVEIVTHDAALAAINVIAKRVAVTSINGNSSSGVALLKKLHKVIQSALMEHIDELFRQSAGIDASAEVDAKRDIWNERLNI